MISAVVLFVCACLSSCFGYSIDPCGDNQTVQVYETEDAVFTCTGITAGDIVRWRVIDTDSSKTELATCLRPGVCICTIKDITATMPDSITSVLNVTGNQRKLAGTLQCGKLSEGYTINTANCQVKVVYMTVDNCSTTVVTTTDPWTVRASCDVDKVFASDGHYSCQWSQQSSSGKNHSFISGDTYLSSFNDSRGREYQRMTCPFSGHPMPTADDTYDYILTTVPRQGSETYRSQSIQIDSPSKPTIHNCPSDVVEGDDVICTCQASASEPPALVMWSSSSGDDVNTTSLPQLLNTLSQLEVTNVNRSLDGHRFTCSQYWAGFSPQHRMVTNYIISVKYPPDTPPDIKGNSTYSAGDCLNMTCSVTGGNPTVASVNLTCGDHNDGQEDTPDQAGDQTVTVRATSLQPLSVKDSGTVCLCSANWALRPDLYTETDSVTIFVPVSRTTRNSDHYPAKRCGTFPVQHETNRSLIIGVVIAVVAAILVVVVIVIGLVRRRNKKDGRNFDKGTSGENEMPRDASPTSYTPQATDVSETHNISLPNDTSPTSTISQSSVASPTSSISQSINTSPTGSISQSINTSPTSSISQSINTSPTVPQSNDTAPTSSSLQPTTLPE